MSAVSTDNNPPGKGTHDGGTTGEGESAGQAGKPNPAFLPAGVAEKQVTEIRNRLRAGNEKGAKDQFWKLWMSLEKQVGRRASAYFNGNTAHVEDAVMEAAVALWGKLSDLRELPGTLYWESRFGPALKCLLSDVFKTLRKRTGMGTEISDADTRSTTEEDAPSALDRAPDPDAERHLGEILGDRSAEALLALVPDPRKREAFRLTAEGVPQADIAARLECDVRSVYNWNQATRALLRQYMEDHYRTGTPEGPTL